MSGLLDAWGFLGLIDGGLTDVLPGGLARDLSGDLDGVEFVGSQADRDGFAAGVVLAGPSAFVGEHDARLAYTQGSESRVGIGIRDTLHGEPVSVYAKPMTSTQTDAAADRRSRIAYMINEEGFTTTEATSIIDAMIEAETAYAAETAGGAR